MAPYNTTPLYESSIEDEDTGSDTGSDTESESEPEDEEWLENERLRQEMEEERLEDERLEQEMEWEWLENKRLQQEMEVVEEYQKQLLFEEEMRQEIEEEEHQQQLLFEEEMLQKMEEEEEEHQQQLLLEAMQQEIGEEVWFDTEMQQRIGEEEYEQQLLEEEETQKYYEEMGYDYDHDGSLISIPTPISNPSDIGPLLYRVFDDESISVYTSVGFIAGASEMPTDSEEFSYMAENHVDWCSRVMTPFISTTNSLDVANWQITLRGRPGIKVAIIDTSTLIDEFDVQVWEILRVMDDFGIEPPGRCTRSTFVGEYICGLYIPDSAVISVCEPEDFMDLAELYLS